VQSVFRSFFRRSREGHFVVTNSESLWRLLARITVLKVLRTSKRHRAGLRDVIAEAEISDDRVFEMLAREPTADEAVALTEEVQLLLERTSPQKREIITLCLQGFTCSEIVARVGCSRLTVRRVLDDAGKQVQERFRL
jgi:DNA-directed RNA polymerase specialized sigma24 family protein